MGFADTRSNTSEEDALLAFLQELFSTPPANPNDYEKIATGELLYFVGSPVDRDENTTANEIAELAKSRPLTKEEGELLHFLQAERLVCLVAPRGSGKTHFFNRFVNSFTATLLEQKRIVWFRIDAAKIARVVKQRGRAPKWHFHEREIFDRYFCIHTAYVLLVYSGIVDIGTVQSNPWFKTFFEQNPISDLSIDPERLLSEFQKTFQRLKDQLRPGTDVSEYFIREMLTSQTASPLFNMLNFFFQYYFPRLTAARHCVIVIDGADNISWDMGDALYREIIDRLRCYMHDVSSQAIYGGCTTLLVARPELLPVIGDLFEHFGYDKPARMPIATIALPHGDADQPAVAKLKATTNPTILANAKSRFIATLTLLQTGSQEGTEDTPTNKLRDLLDDVSRHATGFSKALLEVVNQLATSVPSTEFGEEDLLPVDPLRSIYNFNLRSYFTSMIVTWWLQRRSVRIEFEGAVDQRRILEYILLDGNFFKNSQNFGNVTRTHRSSRTMGVFPNIFWYDVQQVDGNRSRWYGLAGFRLLSLVRAHPRRPADFYLTVLRDILNVPKGLVWEQIYYFVALGVLEVVEFSATERPYRTDQATKNRDDQQSMSPVLKITKKGLLTVQFSLFCFDWLNFLSLDTPFHEDVLRAARRYIRFHHNPLKPGENRSDYLFCGIINVATFLKYAWHAEEQDLRQHLDEKQFDAFNSASDGALGDLSKFTKAISLPEVFWTHTIETFDSLLEKRIRKAESTRKADERLHIENEFLQYCDEVELIRNSVI